MAKEKNSRLEISLEKVKGKNTHLQQQIKLVPTPSLTKETDQRVKELQDSLSGKTNKILRLKEQLDME